MVSQQEGYAQLGNLLPLPSACSDNASDSVCVRGEKEQMAGWSLSAVVLVVFGFILPINHADV